MDVGVFIVVGGVGCVLFWVCVLCLYCLYMVFCIAIKYLNIKLLIFIWKYGLITLHYQIKCSGLGILLYLWVVFLVCVLWLGSLCCVLWGVTSSSSSLCVVVVVLYIYPPALLPSFLPSCYCLLLETDKNRQKG